MERTRRWVAEAFNSRSPLWVLPVIAVFLGGMALGYSRADITLLLLVVFGIAAVWLGGPERRWVLSIVAALALMVVVVAAMMVVALAFAVSMVVGLVVLAVVIAAPFAIVYERARRRAVRPNAGRP